jgi:hypothetical protein
MVSSILRMGVDQGTVSFWGWECRFSVDSHCHDDRAIAWAWNRSKRAPC